MNGGKYKISAKTEDETLYLPLKINLDKFECSQSNHNMYWLSIQLQNYQTKQVITFIESLDSSSSISHNKLVLCKKT